MSGIVMAENHDTRGRFVPGNVAALKDGRRSVQFWNAAQEAISAIRRDVLAQRGYAVEDAPVTLRAAVDSYAQSLLVRDSAFARMVEQGGPLTTKERERGSHKVWAAATAAVLRHVQVIGMDTVAKPAVSITQALRSAPEAR